MNSSTSSDVSSTTKFKNLQFQFLTWAANWVRNEEQPENVTLDMPDLVCILEALGFHIRSMDICHPEETTSLSEGKKGTRIVITCNHSGNRFVLEQPLDEIQCKCIKLPIDGSRDTIWEVIATTPSSKNGSSVIETGSDLIPSVPKEMKQIIYGVTNYLVRLMNGSGDAKVDRLSISSTSENTGKLSLPINYQIPQINEPGCSSDLSSRYRSLDTLTTSRSNANFQQLRPLASSHSGSQSSDVVAQSSPSVLLKVDHIDPKGERVINGKAFALIINALSNLSDAVTMIDNNPYSPSQDSVFERSTSTIKSTENELNVVEEPPSAPMKTMSSPNLVRIPVEDMQPPKSTIAKKTKKVAGASIRALSTACTKGAARTNSTRKTMSTNSMKEKPNVPPLSAKRLNLYAHVKSTIPKPPKKK